MNKEDLMDILIKNALAETMEEIHVPPMEDTWKHIEERIQERKKKLPLYKKSLAVAVLLLIGVVVGSGLNHEGYANYFRTMNIFTSITDQAITVQMHNKMPDEMKDKKGTPPVEEEEKLEDVEMSIEDVRDVANFQMQEPTYMPEGYPLEKVILTSFGKKTIQVKILYGKEDSGIELLQQPLYGQYAASININPKYGRVLEKRVNGLNYMILEFVNGEVKIHWDRNEVKFTLRGNLEREEMLKIAASTR